MIYSEFCDIINNQVSVFKTCETVFSKCIILNIIYSYTYKKVLDTSLGTSIDIYKNKLEELIKNCKNIIPSIILYQNNFTNNNILIDNNEYYSLLLSNDSSFDYICKMIDICPFTIFYVNNLSIKMINYALTIFNNPKYKDKMQINKMMTIDIILSLKKLIYNCNFINYNNSCLIVKYTNFVNNVTSYIDIDDITFYVQKKYNNATLIKNNNKYNVYQNDTKIHNFPNYTIIKKILVATYELY